MKNDNASAPMEVLHKTTADGDPVVLPESMLDAVSGGEA